MTWLDEETKNKEKEAKEKAKWQSRDNNNKRLDQEHFAELVKPYIDQIKKALNEANSQLSVAREPQLRIEIDRDRLTFSLDSKTLNNPLSDFLYTYFTIITNFGEKHVSLRYRAGKYSHALESGSLSHIQPARLTKDHFVTMVGIITQRIHLKSRELSSGTLTYELFNHFSGLLTMPRFILTLIVDS